MNWILLATIAAVLIGLFALKRKSFVSAETARRLLRQGALVVDVRGPGEFNSSHLPGAINIPLGNLTHAALHRVPDKNQVMLLHCLSGTRSWIAKRQLRGIGYRHAFNLGSYGRAEKIVHDAQK